MAKVINNFQLDVTESAVHISYTVSDGDLQKLEGKAITLSSADQVAIDAILASVKAQAESDEGIA